MKRTFLLFSLLGILPLGCSVDATSETDPITPDSCADVYAHLQACFPEQALPNECYPDTEEAILASSCEELAAADGKADGGWMCLWMPWLCTEGGSTSTRGIHVKVDRCSGYFDNIYDCQTTYSSPCTLVVLENGEGQEVDRAYTGTYGSVRFEVTSKEAHIVRILDRGGQTTTQVVGDFSFTPAEAKTNVAAAAGDQTIRMYLPADSELFVKACSTIEGSIDVTDSAGQRLDAEEVEWGWIVRFLAADGTVGLVRPFGRHPDASVSGQWENTFSFPHAYEGMHLFEFVRMNIPNYERKNNPDYERLLRLYSVTSVAQPYGWEQVELHPEQVSVELESGSIPNPVSFYHSFVDPLAP